MTKKLRRVSISTRTVGDHFATIGVVRDAETRRELATTDVVPYNFIEAAVTQATSIAEERGWIVVND